MTEGALNGMAVARGLDDFVFDVGAMGGSELFPAQVIKMSTYKLVIIMTDSDPAGDKAAPALAGMLGRYSRVIKPCPPVAPGKKREQRSDEWGRLPDKKDALDVGRDYLRNILVPVFTSLGVTRVRSTS